MAQLTVNILGNSSNIDSVISDVKTNLQSIKDTTVRVNVDASGLEAIDQIALKYKQAEAKIATANAKIIESSTRLQIEQQKTAQSANNAAAAESRLAVQREKTRVATRNQMNAEQKYWTELNKSGTEALKAQAKITESNNKLYTQQTKLQEQREKQAYQTNRQTVQTEKQTAATEKQTNAQKKLTSATKDGTRANTLLGDSIGNIIAKMAAWQVIGTVVSTVIKSFKEALNTMKEVDQQLTNIQKVSNMTAAEINKIGDSAYETASKYGVAADQYLEAVYTFQKAGLGDSAEKLGELATKTMLVGDTTAAVATKFLISANAAWKFGGSVEALSKIVDEADYINNNYAATLADIATGLPIVGATAAQVGMTAEQTMSAIATIVAATGQTASKASTALRAIIMNLIGQTGELDDGVEVTEASIKSLNDVLNKYAPAALAAAQASGTILDPMEAIAALARAAEDPLVKETELFSVLASLGGKLRTTQLTALVNNLDMYNKMLAGTADAAGTADKEISIMLESWNSKVQILKNTWTQFLAHIVKTDAIKIALNALTAVIKILDSGFVKFLATVGMLTAGVLLLNKAFYALASTTLVNYIRALLSAAAGNKAAAISVQMLSRELRASVGLWVAVAAAALYGVVKLVDALDVTAEECLKKADKARQKYEEYQSEVDRLTDKIQKNKDAINEANIAGGDTSYQLRLFNENKLLQVQLDIQKQLAKEEKDKANRNAQKAWEANSYYFGTGQYQTQADQSAVWEEEIYTSGNIKEYITRLLELAQAGNDVSNELAKAFATLDGIVGNLDETDEKSAQIIADAEVLVEQWHKLFGFAEDAEEPVSDLSDAFDQVTQSVSSAADALKALNAAIDEVQSALDVLTTAQEEYNEAGEISVDTLQALLALDAEYLDALVGENGQLDLNADAISNLIDGKNVLLEKLAGEAIATYAAEEAQRLLKTGIDNSASAAEIAQGKLASAASAMVTLRDDALGAVPAFESFWTALGGYGLEVGLDSSQLETYKANVNAYASNVMQTISSTSMNLGGWKSKSNSKGSSSGGGSSRSDSSTSDEKLAAHKSAVSLAKQKLSFASESGASTAEQVALMRLVQEELHKEAEYLRGIEGESERVIALSTEWWTYQNKINKALEESKESYDDIKEAALAVIDAEEAAAIGPLQEQLDLLKAQKQAIEDERTEEERLLEVEKARIALQNAQNERNVRQYNAATGQWEWVANAQNVAAAQESLTQAEQALSDFYLDREIAELESQIASIQNDYSQQRVKEEMKANSAKWFDADEATRKKLAAENLRLGTEQGWTRGADGVWYDANGNPVYDGGGILHGVGGIKATRGDEMVLPPSMTARLLTAEATGAFDALLNHLGIVTSVANSYAGFGGGITKNSIGEQHNGDTFYIDGVMMQNITESTTLGQLARTARTLSLCKGA